MPLCVMGRVDSGPPTPFIPVIIEAFHARVCHSTWSRCYHFAGTVKGTLSFPFVVYFLRLHCPTIPRIQRVLQRFSYYISCITLIGDRPLVTGP